MFSDSVSSQGLPNRTSCHLKSCHNGAYSALNTAGHDKLGNAHFLNQLYLSEISTNITKYNQYTNITNITKYNTI